ncbi:CobQ/CobB/MinD/ParA nucleotide binding domain protein [Helicobacter pylori GAM96Ai]|uniref:ParA family protein n=2 Tax=Helicobacter pylori TaxID=210 RepID=UPI0002B932BF|nr:ParA family protein [Helicobacter pylori]EMH44881.1 CobQ/CobB/MinD/ParA nucleotide binding domain protein [Helicobacter pylori GAM96Ai]
MLITVTNEKGGSGKSTLAFNLGIALMQKGFSVCVLDTDSQKSQEAYVAARLENELTNFVLFNRTNNFIDTLKSLNEKFDVIIVDTKGDYTNEIKRTMTISHFLIIPTTPSQLDVMVLLDMLARVEDCQIVNENLKALILPNRMPPNPFSEERTTLQKFIREVNKNENVILLDHFLTERISYKRSVNKGLAIFETDDEKAGKEFLQVFDEIMQHLQLTTNQERKA